MEVSFAKCEQILNTLPIGYYTGRRIGVSLEQDENKPMSYYSPMEDKICISYEQLRRAFEKVTDTSKEESTVRNMIYHEVSHAILSSSHMVDYASYDPDYGMAINVFEDERIESVLRNYYFGVNFKQQIYDLNNGVHNPTDAASAYYNLVRFGIGPKNLMQETNDIIDQYADLHRMSRSSDVYHYCRSIISLWEKIKRAYHSDPTQFQVPENMLSAGTGEQGQYSQMQGGSGSQDGSQKEKVQGIMKVSSGEGEGESENGAGNSADGEEQTCDMPAVIGDPTHGLGRSLEQIRRLIEKGLDIKSRLGEGGKEQLDEFEKTAERIIANFNKKNIGGSGINAYSGVFNPRALKRQDYRYFERSLSIQGNNKFGTCHLNLFIDCSGSFDNNENLVNGMLAILSNIERKNRNFSLDVVFCGNGVHKCQNVKERQIKCSGGNNLPDDMKEVFMSLQKQNTCNYNVVLFDGDAFSDCWSNNRGERCNKIFSTFDYKQTSLITDPENEVYMGDGFSTAQVVVTNNYTDELIKHVIQALTIAFG